MLGLMLEFITCPRVNQSQPAYASAYIHDEKVVFNVSIPLQNNTGVFIGFTSPNGRTTQLPGDNVNPSSSIFVPEDLMYSCFNTTVNPTGGEYWVIQQSSCNYANFIGEFPLNFSQFYHQTLRNFGKIYVKVGAYEQEFPFIIEAQLESDLSLKLNKYGMIVYDPIVYNSKMVYPVKGNYCNFSSLDNVTSTTTECDLACTEEASIHEIAYDILTVGENNRQLRFNFSVFNCTDDPQIYLPQQVVFNVYQVPTVNMLSEQLNPVYINILNKDHYYFYSQDNILLAYCDDDKLHTSKREFVFNSCDKLNVKFERGWVNISLTYVPFSNILNYVYYPGQTRVPQWHKGGFVCNALAFQLFAYGQQVFWENSLGLDCGEGQVLVKDVCKDGSTIEGIMAGVAAVGAAIIMM